MGCYPEREEVKQLGRIPSVTHTDHANLARLETIDIGRTDSKHLRWFEEFIEGGSLLLYRPGASALHKGPEGLSRNCEGRDNLILAKASEWEGYREKIRGVRAAIISGETADEEPEPLTIERLEREQPESLQPLPTAQGLAVSLNYERGHDHRFSDAMTGDTDSRASSSDTGRAMSSARGAELAKAKVKAKSELEWRSKPKAGSICSSSEGASTSKSCEEAVSRLS